MAGRCVVTFPLLAQAKRFNCESLTGHFHCFMDLHLRLCVIIALKLSGPMTFSLAVIRPILFCQPLHHFNAAGFFSSMKIRK